MVASTSLRDSNLERPTPGCTSGHHQNGLNLDSGTRSISSDYARHTAFASCILFFYYVKPSSFYAEFRRRAVYLHEPCISRLPRRQRLPRALIRASHRQAIKELKRKKV